jgi:hypothetical protein
MNLSLKDSPPGTGNRLINNYRGREVSQKAGLWLGSFCVSVSLPIVFSCFHKVSKCSSTRMAPVEKMLGDGTDSGIIIIIGCTGT